LETLERVSQVGLVRLELLIPYDRAGAEAEVLRRGRVLRRDYGANGLRLTAEVPSSETGRFEAYAVTQESAAPRSRAATD
jgi:hypothetical protein